MQASLFRQKATDMCGDLARMVLKREMAALVSFAFRGCSFAHSFKIVLTYKMIHYRLRNFGAGGDSGP
jgi:hypothetical protein